MRETIPISKVKAKIKELEDWNQGINEDRTEYAIEILKELLSK